MREIGPLVKAHCKGMDNRRILSSWWIATAFRPLNDACEARVVRRLVADHPQPSPGKRVPRGTAVQVAREYSGGGTLVVCTETPPSDSKILLECLSDADLKFRQFRTTASMYYPPFFLHFSSAGMRRLEEHENMQRDCPDQQGKPRSPARHLASRLPAHGSALSQAARTVAKRRLPPPVNPPGRSSPHFGKKTPRQIMAQRPFAGWRSKVTSLLSQHERYRAYPHEIF